MERRPQEATGDVDPLPQSLFRGGSVVVIPQPVLEGLMFPWAIRPFMPISSWIRSPVLTLSSHDLGLPETELSDSLSPTSPRRHPPAAPLTLPERGRAGP
jgi:hypothetical protein